ncbi:MAG: hypothetical protein H6735_20055 [Alphaproteobacteria bacterium]|nr:hypothetical protein [Alphaproteobacteria bacterium]
MRKPFLLAIPLAVVGLGYGAWSWWSTGPSDDPKLFANRVWVDRARKDDRDMVRYLVPLDVAGKRRGTTGASSKYRFAGEVFGWSRDGAKLVVDLPQEGRRIEVPVRTWACGATEAPPGFDLCLELGSGDAKARLYSRKGWRTPKGDDLPVNVPDPGEVSGCGPCAPAGLDALGLDGA